jgi:hypothetical protein
MELLRSTLMEAHCAHCSTSDPLIERPPGHIESIKSIETLQKMRNSLNPAPMCIFVIDEISTTDGVCIATVVDSRMKQLMANDLDFGGVAMLFVGDFNQLPPVQAELLALAMMQAAEIENQQTSLPKYQSFTAAINSGGSSDSTATTPDTRNDGHSAAIKTSTSRPLQRVSMAGCAFNDSKSHRNENKKRKQRAMKKQISSHGRHGVDSTLRRGAKPFSQFETISVHSTEGRG